MFILRDDVESCPSGHVSCMPADIAVSGTDPSTTTNPAGSPSYVNKPGMHRYIGILMVIVIVLIGVVLWARLAKYPRRKLSELSQRCGCCGTRRSKHDSEKSNSGDISRTMSTSSSDTSRSQLKGDEEGKEAVARDEAAVKSERRRAEKAKLREKERNLMLQAEPRGVIKEVSGGVVMYTKVPRPALLPHKDRHPQREWEFQHVHGVQFEVSIVSSFALFSSLREFFRSRLAPLLRDEAPERAMDRWRARAASSMFGSTAESSAIARGSVATPPFQEQALEPAKLVVIISVKAKP